VEPDYLPDAEVLCFQPCLYPMKYLHPISMYTLPFSSPLCPSYLGRFRRPILFLLSEGNSGLQVPAVLRADNPCFHSWGGGW
jgi:hypothetical protein